MLPQSFRIVAHLTNDSLMKCMNVPDQYLSALPTGATFGGGPFREVRMFVDGQLAGAVFPYVNISLRHVRR